MQFGFVAIYLSESFIRGFMTAAGLQILISVLKYVFGLTVPSYTGPLAIVYVSGCLDRGLPCTSSPPHRRHHCHCAGETGTGRRGEAGGRGNAAGCIPVLLPHHILGCLPVMTIMSYCPLGLESHDTFSSSLPFRLSLIFAKVYPKPMWPPWSML